MAKILLTNDVKEDKTAGLKAKMDVLQILKEEGYQPLYFPRLRSFKIIREFWKNLSKTVKKGDHIVVEFPCWLKRRLYVVKAFAMVRNVPFYAIIHDIVSIRQQVSPKRDIAALKLFDGVVSHNYSMTRWLRQNGYKGKIIDLNAFDYCLDKKNPYAVGDAENPYKLLYAGNLSFAKAEYIYNSRIAGLKNFQLHVYGQYLEEDKFKGSGVVYKGTFNPDTPVFDCTYQFGLIWEGTSIDTCDGEYGNYIRFNNSHKFSLYMSLGLPVITWKEAAIAQFVLDNKIGFVVTNLADLNEQLAKLPKEKYQEYAANVLKISPDVRNGHFMKTALSKLVNA